MKIDEIKEHLRLHALWLQGDSQGKRADLRFADLSGANLSCANLRGADLSCADLSGADLSCANLRGADLFCADLSGADLRGADLFCANLRGADLFCADLSGADLSCADLSGADLFCADLSGADLRGADLFCANLRGADLFCADLSGANLSCADLFETCLSGKVILSFQFEKHAAYFFGSDEIQIGCHKMSVADWLAQYQEIGAKEGYTDEQVRKYGRFIKGCANILKDEASEALKAAGEGEK